MTKSDKAREERLAAALRDRPPPKPLFVGFAAAHAALAGYSLDEARAALAGVGVAAMHDHPLELVRALRMEPAELAKRMRAMRRHLARHDLDHWASSFFDALQGQQDS